MSQLIYKICPQQLWNDAVANGVFPGAEIDVQDGFIHFSAAHQVQETARKHFHGQTNLVLVAVEESVLGDKLKWETSRGGDLFPHLYGPLQTTSVSQVIQLTSDLNGTPIVPLTDHE